MQTQTISADDLRRNFGAVKKKLPFVDFIITDRGNPVGVLKATPDMKKQLMKKAAGAFKGTELDSDSL
jgi:hypothetical protein